MHKMTVDEAINILSFVLSPEVPALRVLIDHIAELESRLAWTKITKDESTWPPKDGTYVLTATPTGPDHWLCFVTWGYAARPDEIARFEVNGQQWKRVDLPETDDA